jgi:hypothetical protein
MTMTLYGISRRSPIYPDYNGLIYNVLVELENGETTKEFLRVIAKDNPVTCAIYAKDHELLNKTGWKQFKAIAKRHKSVYSRMVNHAKLRSFKHAPNFNYGSEVSKTFDKAVCLDETNGNRYGKKLSRPLLMNQFSLTKGITLKQTL